MVPIHEYLVPSLPPTPPASAVRTRQPLLRGLPHRVTLERDLALLVVAGTGLATIWRDAPPDTLISTHLDELAPRPIAKSPTVVGAVGRLMTRVLLLQGQTPLAAIPLALGLHRLTPDHGGTGDADRTLIELWIIGWDIRAGNMRGPGELGAFIEIAWRRADLPSVTFSQPAVHPAVAEREPALAYQSEVG